MYFFVDGKVRAYACGETIKVEFLRRGSNGEEIVAKECDMTRGSALATIDALVKAVKEMERQEAKILRFPHHATSG